MNPYLRICTWERLWWTLWLFGRWSEFEMEPPPNATFADVIHMADQLRAKGADVEVVYP